MTPRQFCDLASPDPSLACRGESDGIRTYVDLENGETENNVLVIEVVQPASSPNRHKRVLKFSKDVRLRASKRGSALDEVSYFDVQKGMIGTPGLYPLGSSFAYSLVASNGSAAGIADRVNPEFAFAGDNAPDGCATGDARIAMERDAERFAVPFDLPSSLP